MSRTELSLIHEVSPPRTGSGPHPGLLLLHGLGADERDLLPLAAELDARLCTVSARAPLEWSFGGFAWYDLDTRGIGFPNLRSLRASLDLLERFLEEVVAAYSIDPQRLYVGGFSMGGAMSALLTLLFPERVRGALILSGYIPLEAGLPFRTDEAAQHPVFQAHGTQDEMIPIQLARRTRDFLQGTPVQLTYNEYSMAHEISYPELQDMTAWLTGILDADVHSPTDAATNRTTTA